MRSVVVRRFLAGFALMCAGGVAIATNSSCVLIDGPPDLPVPPNRRPTILRSQVLPPATAPIGALLPNGEFDVPVEMPDPTQTATWYVFVDYSDDNQRPLAVGNIGGSSSAPDITTVLFNVSPSLVVGTQCHTIHFLVALASAISQSNPHDTDPFLSDTVDWYFAPGGNAGGCSTYDGGGNDAAFPNVDANLDDAGDGSVD